MNTKPYTFDRVVRMLIGLTILVLLFLLVKRLSDVLLPFLIAWLLAYLLQPIVLFFQYKLKFKNRILSIACTLMLFFSFLTAIVWLVVPLITNEVQKLTQLIVLYTQGLNVDTFFPAAWQNDIRQYLSQMNIQSILQDENFMSVVKKLAPKLWDLINGSLSFVLGLAVVLIVFLYLIFILLDYEKFVAGWSLVIPIKYRPLVTEIMHDLETGMNQYFRGQAIVSITVGVLLAVGFSIIQLPLAIVIGLVIGLMNMVPYLQTLGIIPCLILALFKSVETGQNYGSIVLGVVVVIIVVQLIEDLLLVPKIMGKVTGLKPAVILLSLSIWGSLMGVVGMIIALPMTTLMISYYNRFILNEQKIEKPEQTEIHSEELPEKK